MEEWGLTPACLRFFSIDNSNLCERLTLPLNINEEVNDKERGRVTALFHCFFFHWKKYDYEEYRFYHWIPIILYSTWK